jgi:hypothetical protein
MNSVKTSTDFDSNNKAPWQSTAKKIRPYMTPLNGTDNRMKAGDTDTITDTVIKRQTYWLYIKGKKQADGQRDTNRWRPPSTGPIVI